MSTSERIIAAGLVLFAAAPEASSAQSRTSQNYLDLSVQIRPRCRVNVGEMNFGTYDVETGNQGVSQLELWCTPFTRYSVAIDGGGTGSPANRAMSRASGQDNIAYQLYQDPAGNTVWGDGLEGETREFTAGWQQIELNIYGFVEPQQVVRSGSYSDTVRITVTY